MLSSLNSLKARLKVSFQDCFVRSVGSSGPRPERAGARVSAWATGSACPRARRANVAGRGPDGQSGGHETRIWRIGAARGGAELHPVVHRPAPQEADVAQVVLV